MSEKEQNSLDGITVGGVPLENILEDEEQSKHEKETQEVTSEDTKKHKIYRRPSRTNGKSVGLKDKRRGKVHLLSAREKNKQYWPEMLRALVAQKQPVTMLVIQRLLSGEKATIKEHHSVAVGHGGAKPNLSAWQSVLSSTWKKFPIWYLIERKPLNGKVRTHALVKEALYFDVDTLSKLAQKRGWKRLESIAAEYPWIVEYFPDEVLATHGLSHLKLEIKSSDYDDDYANVLEDEAIEVPEFELPPVATYEGAQMGTPPKVTTSIEDILCDLRRAALRAGMIVEINFKSI